MLWTHTSLSCPQWQDRTVNLCWFFCFGFRIIRALATYIPALSVSDGSTIFHSQENIEVAVNCPTEIGSQAYRSTDRHTGGRVLPIGPLTSPAAGERDLESVCAHTCIWSWALFCIATSVAIKLRPQVNGTAFYCEGSLCHTRKYGVPMREMFNICHFLGNRIKALAVTGLY